ncbi:MAG: AsmA-like C-terminal region-containing protein [Bryobacteraceae bacterium]
MRRTVIVSALAVVALLVIGIAILSSTVDRFRPRIQSELQKKLNRQVTLGHLGLRIFPLSVKIDSFLIGEDPTFSTGRPFAQAQQVFVSVGLFSLITGNPEVKSLVLDRPQIELVKNTKGVWNFSTLGTNRAKTNDSDQFSLDNLRIRNGNVGLTDQLAGEPRVVYNGINLDVDGYGPGKRFGVELGLNLPGQAQQELAFKGKVGPIQPENAASTPVSGHLTAKEVSLASFNRLSPGLLPPKTDGILTADADVSTEKEVASVKGDFKLDNSQLRGNKLPFPMAAQFDATANRATDQIQIRSGSFNLGGTAFTATGQIDTGKKPANLNLHVRTSNSSLTELAKLSGALGVAFNPAYQIKGTVSADITATGTAAAPQLNGSFSARNLDVSGGEIKQPVKVAAINVTLSPDLIQAQPFTAQSGSTSLQIAGSLAHYNSPSRSVDATVNTANANIAELLNMAKAYGINGTNGASGAGSLSMNIHVQGPTANMSNLVLSGSGTISGATLKTPALTKPVSVTSASMQFAQNSASISSLNAAVGSTTLHGNVSAKNFSAPQLNFALTADNIDTAELESLTSTSSQGKGPAPKAQKQSSLINEITGSGTLAAGRIKSEDIILTNVHTTCRLDHGLVQLSPLTADLFGGKQEGALTLDLRPEKPLCSVHSKLSGVDSNALLSAVSSLRDTLYGPLSANTALGFTLGSSAEMAKTLNGNLEFQIVNGQLKNINILNEVAKIGKFLNSAPVQSGSGTALRKLSGTLLIQNGVASTNNLSAVLDTGSLAAKGQLNLVNQGLNMHVNAVLGSQVSQSVGGSGIGGFLNTALSNSKGELVIPVNVTGTTTHPVFTPDMQALAQMKLNNLLPTSGDPSKLTSGVVGAISGKKGVGGAINQVLGGQQSQNPNGQGKQEQNPLNSIFKQLGKKPQK